MRFLLFQMCWLGQKEGITAAPVKSPGHDSTSTDQYRPRLILPLDRTLFSGHE